MTASDSVSPTDAYLPSATVPIQRVAIFAATFWERAAVQAAFRTSVVRHVDRMPVQVCVEGHREYWLVQTGMGLEKAGQAAARLLRHQPFSLAVSTGFACALITAEVGALLVGCDVILVEEQGGAASPAIESPGDEREMVRKLVESTGQASYVGRFVSTSRVITSASGKRWFAGATGAIGLDMESAALAVEAQRTRVPFVIVRAASDLSGEDLPLDFNLFLRPTGWLKGVASVIGNPSSVAGLCRLRRQSQAAAKNLTMFFRRYVQDDRPMV